MTFFFKFVKIRKNLEEVIMDNKLDIVEKQKINTVFKIITNDEVIYKYT